MIAIGLDVVEVPRFRAALERRPRLLDRLFSGRERADLSERADPVPGFAARFAAKEAMLKALGVGLGACAFCEIEVLRLPSGAPNLATSGRAASLVEARGATALSVSLTHTDSLAAAIVVLS